MHLHLRHRADRWVGLVLGPGFKDDALALDWAASTFVVVAIAGLDRYADNPLAGFGPCIERGDPIGRDAVLAAQARQSSVDLRKVHAG